MTPRRYHSDDRDLERGDNDLLVYPGGNGDWYVTIVEHGKRLGPTVRITTSGSPDGQEGVAAAVAHLFRAMGGERDPAVAEQRPALEAMSRAQLVAWAEQLQRGIAERDETIAELVGRLNDAENNR